MPRSATLTKALQSADLALREYVRALEKENAKLQAQLGRLEARRVSTENENGSLRRLLREQGIPNPADQLARRLKAARKRVAGLAR
jgi:hypothetical protein